MKKKRIFISIYYLEIGGAEKSLISLLNNIDYHKYSVDLFVHKHMGELMKEIPEMVNLLPEDENYSTFSTPIIDVIKKGKYNIAYGRLKAKIKSKFFRYIYKINNNISDFLYVTTYTEKYLPSLEKYGYYDLAISYIAPHNIVLSKVKARKKIAWIHTDYSKINLDIKNEKKVWKKYDHIISISQNVTLSFLKIFPDLENKIILMENIIEPQKIRELANENIVDKEAFNDDNVIKICSVGRFSYAKNFENAVLICKKLVEKKLNVKWYLIGFGSFEKKIRRAIKENHLEDHFIILGKKNNPYPYIKLCDYYIQPSRYEGKAVTVLEAQILHKPVIITNFPTAKSQLRNDIDGIIVPLDNDKAAESIYSFLNNKEKQKEIIDNLKNSNFDNKKELEKIYKLID